MNNMKKLLSLLLAALMVVSMAACNPNGPGNESTGGGDGKTATYGVTVQSAGKMPLKGISVEVYEDDTLSNMVNVATTDENGKVSFTMAVSDKYAMKLSNVPEGYETQKSYAFTGGGTVITISSALIPGKDLSNFVGSGQVSSDKVGSVMYDFEVTDVDGNTHKLSEILKVKKAVILNLYFNQCSPCRQEMPYMNEAYGMYSEKLELLALNPQKGSAENESACKLFRDELELDFPVCKAPAGWASMTLNTSDGQTAFPTTYVIDRYGVVCLALSGTEPNLRTWTGVMEHFTADDYEQKLITSMDQIVTKVKPNVDPLTPEELAAAIGDADGNIVYSNVTDDEYTWPFVSAEKDGQTVLKPSNSGVDVSYAILRLDVTMKKGQALGFDYLVSSEAGSDVFHVIVNDTPIYNMSGVDDTPTWKSCYPWVAPKDGTYKVVLTYLKDSSDSEGDDTVYLKNMRLVDNSQIDTPSYIPMEAAISEDGFAFEYAQIVYNETDGYYHVGTANGPLLLANLMTVSQFNEETSIYLMALDKVFGEDLLTKISPFASYAANSKMQNYCTVNKELAELLKQCVAIAGFEGNDSEWLKLCKYYAAYGTNGVQMADPIEGLATFSALPAQEGMNEIPYLEGIPIMPRGKIAKFVPTRSGVYRITSHDQGKVEKAYLSAWIFGEDHKTPVASDESISERYLELQNFNPVSDVTMLCYMEAGKAYYIDIAYWDPYTAGTIPYSIEYLGPTYRVFTMASPGPFTYDTNETGDAIYGLIHGGIDAVLNPADGYYHQDLGKDENGNQLYGSVIYADFIEVPQISLPIADVQATGSNGQPTTIYGLITRGAFDFGKTAEDDDVLWAIKQVGDDFDTVCDYLVKQWGEEVVQQSKKLIEDVLNGVYHGKGEDRTAEMTAYLSKMLQTPSEAKGCVAVDETLAEILQQLEDKFVFENVDQSWLKLCYYYVTLGPA